MKNILLLIMLVYTSSTFAQTKKTAEIKIKTSAECDQCKKRIESNLIYEKGVKFCKLDMASKVLTVSYNTEKTNPEKIKKAVTMLGYVADEIKSDSLAYAKLPACCKVGGSKDE